MIPDKKEIFTKLGLKWLTIPMGIFITSLAGSALNLPVRIWDFIIQTDPWMADLVSSPLTHSLSLPLLSVSIS